LPRDNKWIVSKVVGEFATKREALEFMEERVADAREKFVTTGNWGDVDLVLFTNSVTAKVVRNARLTGTLSEYHLSEHPEGKYKTKRRTVMNEVHPDALKQMMGSPSNYDSTRWASYQNTAMDSSNLGDMRFLAVGPENTYKEPPASYPDTTASTAWAYRFIGWVDVGTGEVIEDG